MPSPNLSKPSSMGSASLAPSLDRQVRSSTSAVILAIVVLNTLGIVLLFFKLDWDVRQISAEMGLVRDAVKAEKVVRERAMMKGENTDDFLSVDQECYLNSCDDLSVPPTQTHSSAEYTFEYPADFFLSSYVDLNDQAALRIASSPGTTESFTSGYEMRIEKLPDVHGGWPGYAEPTANPNVARRIGWCEDAGCAQELYTFIGSEANYAIAVYYSEDYNMQHAVTATNQIITSLHE